MASGLSGFLAQVCTTLGFRYTDAQTGALVQTSRIVFATVLGVLLFADRVTPRILAGGLLITVALVGCSGALPPAILDRFRAGGGSRRRGG